MEKESKKRKITEGKAAQVDPEVPGKVPAYTDADTLKSYRDYFAKNPIKSILETCDTETDSAARLVYAISRIQVIPPATAASISHDSLLDSFKIESVKGVVVNVTYGGRPVNQDTLDRIKFYEKVRMYNPWMLVKGDGLAYVPRVSSNIEGYWTTKNPHRMIKGEQAEAIANLILDCLRNLRGVGELGIIATNGMTLLTSIFPNGDIEPAKYKPILDKMTRLAKGECMELAQNALEVTGPLAIFVRAIAGHQCKTLSWDGLKAKLGSIPLSARSAILAANENIRIPLEVKDSTDVFRSGEDMAIRYNSLDEVPDQRFIIMNPQTVAARLLASWAENGFPVYAVSNNAAALSRRPKSKTNAAFKPIANPILWAKEDVVFLRNSLQSVDNDVQQDSEEDVAIETGLQEAVDV